MWFMTKIIEYLNEIVDWLYNFYLDHFNEIWPMYLLANIAYELSWFFGKFASRLSEFFSWILTQTARLDEFLSWGAITAKILEWLPDLEIAMDWFLARISWFYTRVTIWWSATWSTVKGYIDTATQGLNNLVETWSNFWNITFPEWTGKLDILKAAWDSFWTVTFPSLVSFNWLDTWWSDRLKELDGLINDTLKVWFPFYDDLAALWEDIKLFFTDPLLWLYDRLDEWFERFW